MQAVKGHIGFTKPFYVKRVVKFQAGGSSNFGSFMGIFTVSMLAKTFINQTLQISSPMLSRCIIFKFFRNAKIFSKTGQTGLSFSQHVW